MRVPPTSRGAPFPPPSVRGGILSLRGLESIPGVTVASQEEALSTGKARGTPGSCHHSQSPPDVSVDSRKTCFPCTASTFKPRIDSHHGDTWDSPVGKPRGKASRESHRSLDPPDGKCDTAATVREESSRESSIICVSAPPISSDMVVMRIFITVNSVFKPAVRCG